MDDKDDGFLELLEEYNAYVDSRIKLICELDVWYEQTTGKPFPKEWYGKIRARGGKTV
jgi:hypothetical protein